MFEKFFPIKKSNRKKRLIKERNTIDTRYEYFGKLMNDKRKNRSVNNWTIYKCISIDPFVYLINHSMVKALIYLGIFG